MRQGARQFDSAGDALNAVFTDLSNVLQSHGQCWGNDESGQKFAKQYSPGSQNALKAMQDLTKALHGLAKNVAASADSYDGTESGNKSDLSG
ncbi:MAG: WXG100 family type VII secretion target [Sciscionella sp.]|nr:WXG100 family type VII secretion target [Sciscionella sp.]